MSIDTTKLMVGDRIAYESDATVWEVRNSVGTKHGMRKLTLRLLGGFKPNVTVKTAERTWLAGGLVHGIQQIDTTGRWRLYAVRVAGVTAAYLPEGGVLQLHEGQDGKEPGAPTVEVPAFATTSGRPKPEDFTLKDVEAAVEHLSRFNIRESRGARVEVKHVEHAEIRDVKIEARIVQSKTAPTFHIGASWYEVDDALDAPNTPQLDRLRHLWDGLALAIESTGNAEALFVNQVELTVAKLPSIVDREAFRAACAARADDPKKSAVQNAASIATYLLASERCVCDYETGLRTSRAFPGSFVKCYVAAKRARTTAPPVGPWTVRRWWNRV